MVGDAIVARLDFLEESYELLVDDWESVEKSFFGEDLADYGDKLVILGGLLEVKNVETKIVHKVKLGNWFTAQVEDFLNCLFVDWTESSEGLSCNLFLIQQRHSSSFGSQQGDLFFLKWRNEGHSVGIGHSFCPLGALLVLSLPVSDLLTNLLVELLDIVELTRRNDLDAVSDLGDNTLENSFVILLNEPQDGDDSLVRVHVLGVQAVKLLFHWELYEKDLPGGQLPVDHNRVEQAQVESLESDVGVGDLDDAHDQDGYDEGAFKGEVVDSSLLFEAICVAIQEVVEEEEREQKYINDVEY